MLDSVRSQRASAHSQAPSIDQPPLTVGLLHLGSPVHGINRYGRMIAAEMRRFPGVSVLEHNHDLTRHGWRGVADAARATRRFSGADVVVVPYCPNGLWGSQRGKLPQLLTVLTGTPTPVVTVLHDVYHPGSRRRSEWWAMAMCTALPKAVVIHGEHERPRLESLPRSARAQVIPHFIEHRPAMARNDAREALGVRSDRKVVGVLGWIHPRKHYELAIHLLAALDEDFELWLIGSPPEPSRSYGDALLALAAELGVADRMTVTGYVDETELSLRIAALDVGLCPYRDASASGSMSTLLSGRRPIVANDFAVAEELKRLAPDAITLMPDSDIASYREAVVDAATEAPPSQAFDAVLQRRSPEAIAGQYLATLRAVAA